MKKKVIRWAAALAALLFAVLVGVLIVRFVSDEDSFERWTAAHAVLGWLAYVGMVMFQVLVAFIPGEPLEIAGGYAFGAWEGTLLCMAGAAAGSMAVFGLVRRYGARAAEVFFEPERMRKIKFLQNAKKRDMLLAIVFILPGTPKDLLCYFAGLTDIKWPLWLALCSLGRLPSIVTSTVGGSALGTENYWAAAAVFAGTILLSLGGIALYHRICDRHGTAAGDGKERGE